MDLTTTVLSGLGLSGAAGLNAYIPLFLVGLLDRFGVISLASPYDTLSSTPALVVVGVLLIVEILADKIPVADSVNDVVQTIVRPLAGAVLFAGAIVSTSHAPAWVGLVAGLFSAGGVHATKAAVRPAVNASTLGFGAPVVSTVEDIVSLVATMLAIFAPVLLAVFVALIAWWVMRAMRRWRAQRSPA